MKRPLTLLLLATAAAGIAVSGVASAAPEPGGLVPGLPSDPYACDGDAVRRTQAQADPQILSYLSVHPDLESELVRIHGLPAAQRSAEWQAYGRAHSDVVAGYDDALGPIHDYHQLCDDNGQINRASQFYFPGA